MKIIFATNNQHKADEIRAAMPPAFEIATLKDAGILIDIPEPYDTLQDNAREKARVISELKGEACFSEDTGLEVEALNGEPGVKSARYAGEGRDFSENIKKLLENLQGKENKAARFRTVICLMLDGQEHFFEGICRGTIIPVPQGDKGFGYDPIFVPEGADNSFAEMSMEEKNRFSHRRKAVDKLIAFLKNRL